MKKRFMRKKLRLRLIIILLCLGAILMISFFVQDGEDTLFSESSSATPISTIVESLDDCRETTIHVNGASYDLPRAPIGTIWNLHNNFLKQYCYYFLCDTDSKWKVMNFERGESCVIPNGFGGKSDGQCDGNGHCVCIEGEEIHDESGFECYYFECINGNWIKKYEKQGTVCKYDFEEVPGYFGEPRNGECDGRGNCVCKNGDQIKFDCYNYVCENHAWKRVLISNGYPCQITRGGVCDNGECITPSSTTITCPISLPIELCSNKNEGTVIPGDFCCAWKCVCHWYSAELICEWERKYKDNEELPLCPIDASADAICRCLDPEPNRGRAYDPTCCNMGEICTSEWLFHWAAKMVCKPGTSTSQSSEQIYYSPQTQPNLFEKIKCFFSRSC